jgi:hypothetical protein
MTTEILLFFGMFILLAIARQDLLITIFKEIIAILTKIIDILRETLNTVLTKIVDEYLEKLSSGRYFILVSIISTVCIVTLYCLGLLRSRLITVEVFLGIFALTSSIASGICGYYFGQANTASKDQKNSNGQ